MVHTQETSIIRDHICRQHWIKNTYTHEVQGSHRAKPLGVTASTALALSEGVTSVTSVGSQFMSIFQQKFNSMD